MKTRPFFQRHQSKNTVRYFLLIVLALAFLFFSGDFGLVNVQKTAIVMAVGVDKEDDSFIVTSQIAVPQPSGQDKSTKTVQLVSRGKTVAQAFSQINAKTGWYPKLVFCHLIVLGEKTVESDVFDALNFFLLDEYMPDSCLLVTCEKTAAELLNVTPLIDSSGSVAIQKVVSDYAERVGLALPTTLREFAIGYAGESKSAFMPLVKPAPQQEKSQQKSPSDSSSSSGSSGSSDSSGGGQSGGQGGGQSGGQSGKSGEEQPVFTAGETALFVGGKKVGEFNAEETFAFNAVKNDLKLAAYSVTENGKTCTLNIRRNQPKTKLKVGADGKATFQITLTLSAGLNDYSAAKSPNAFQDAGDVPSWVFPRAEKKLAAEINSAFEKCRAVNCDLFELSDTLQKFENARFRGLKNELLPNARLELSVRFRGVR